jgi:hypothetical protein
VATPPPSSTRARPENEKKERNIFSAVFARFEIWRQNEIRGNKMEESMKYNSRKVGKYVETSIDSMQLVSAAASGDVTAQVASAQLFTAASTLSRTLRPVL